MSNRVFTYVWCLGWDALNSRELLGHITPHGHSRSFITARKSPSSRSPYVVAVSPWCKHSERPRWKLPAFLWPTLRSHEASLSLHTIDSVRTHGTQEEGVHKSMYTVRHSSLGDQFWRTGTTQATLITVFLSGHPIQLKENTQGYC